MTERELEMAKARLLGALEGEIASTSKFAGALAKGDLLGLDPHHHERLRDRIAGVSVDALRQILHRYFDEKSAGIAVYGDQQALSSELARFGEVQWSRPEPD